MDWQQLLAYITDAVDQELLLRNAYLVTENRVLRHQITGRVRLSDGERTTLAESGKKLGKQALTEVATLGKPATILAWHRQLVAQKCNGSQQRQSPGRPTIDEALETLIVRIAREHRSWGYDRIAGARANPGHSSSDQAVGDLRKRRGISPAPERKTTTTWTECIHPHLDLLAATDCFTTEVGTLGMDVARVQASLRAAERCLRTGGGTVPSIAPTLRAFRPPSVPESGGGCDGTRPHTGSHSRKRLIEYFDYTG